MWTICCEAPWPPPRYGPKSCLGSSLVLVCMPLVRHIGVGRVGQRVAIAACWPDEFLILTIKGYRAVKMLIFGPLKPKKQVLPHLETDSVL